MVQDLKSQLRVLGIREVENERSSLVSVSLGMKIELIQSIFKLKSALSCPSSVIFRRRWLVFAESKTFSHQVDNLSSDLVSVGSPSDFNACINIRPHLSWLLSIECVV